MIGTVPDLSRSESPLPFTFIIPTLKNHKAVLQAIHLYSREPAYHDEPKYSMSEVIDTFILPA